MKQRLAPLVLALVLVLAGLLGAADAAAQQTLPEPGRSGNNADMWRGARQGVQGYVSIPNPQAGVLVQSEGENWRNWRNGPISTYGTWLLLGIIVVLALFLAIRGRIRVEAGPSPRRIKRFGAIERFSHWLTATSFILLGLTGLNMLYGRYVLRPLIGADAFSTLTAWGKYLHNYISFAFVLGVLLLVVLWVRHNLPTRADLTWLAMGGGLFGKGKHPPAHKFNAGQKLVFWGVVLFGLAISVSGFLLMFPFTIADLHQMQLTQLGHSIVALLFIAMIIAHIYIGTVGMEGAFEAMNSGMVDENWAREHHSLWVAEVKGEQPPADHEPHGPAPAGGARRPA
jgi:formate dehydrogenase subunit gamma